MRTAKLPPKNVSLLCALLLVGATAQAATLLKERFEQTVPLRPGSEVRLSNANGGGRAATRRPAS